MFVAFMFFADIYQYKSTDENPSVKRYFKMQWSPRKAKLSSKFGDLRSHVKDRLPVFWHNTTLDESRIHSTEHPEQETLLRKIQEKAKKENEDMSDNKANLQVQNEITKDDSLKRHANVTFKNVDNGVESSEKIATQNNKNEATCSNETGSQPRDSTMSMNTQYSTSDDDIHNADIKDKTVSAEIHASEGTVDKAEEESKDVEHKDDVIEANKEEKDAGQESEKREQKEQTK